MDRPDPATSGGPGGHHIALGRALAVIVVTVVLGVLIVHSWGTQASTTSSTLPAAAGSTTTTTTLPSTTTTTTPHSQVKVLVANASTTNNVASEYATVLKNADWNVLAPVTANPPARATSVVYYAAHKRADAEVIAQAFGLPHSSVLPVSSHTPVRSVAGADVVLVIGADLAAQTPPSTVPAATTTS